MKNTNIAWSAAAYSGHAYSAADLAARVAPMFAVADATAVSVVGVDERTRINPQGGRPPRGESR